VKGRLARAVKDGAFYPREPAAVKALLVKKIKFDAALLEKSWPNFEFKIASTIRLSIL